MNRSISKRTSPVVAAVADRTDRWAGVLPAPTPNYNPDLEITIGDLAKRNNWSKGKAAGWLAAEGWEGNEVMVGKRKAMAYRPPKK